MNSRELSEQARNVLRNIPLDNLDIPNRVKNALSRQNIDNALEAIITIESRLEGTKGIGEKSVNESIKSVQNVLSKINEIEPDLIHNFLDYRETYFEHANGNFLEILIPIADLYFEKKTGKHGLRDRDVLYKRFNLENQGSYTLEDIGTYYDLTRERVRQIEEKSIADLQKVLLGTYGNKKWKLDTRITDRYRELSEALKSKDFILTDNELKSLLDELFESTPPDTVLSLLMEIVGYTELPNRIDGFRGSLKKCWCSTSQFNRKELEAIFRSLDIIFDRVEPIKMFDLIVSAKKKAKKKVSNDSIHVALKACEQIEVEDDLVSIKFNYLRSAADKAYRILVSKNKPMHFSDLCKEINLVDGQHTRDSKPINQTNMKNQLVGDARFKPIGRSGEWGLASWAEFENITIVQAIESVLHRSGSPLTFAEISRGVNEIRPDASKRSFRVYLTNEPEKFTQVDQDLYALASWQMSPFQRRSVQKVTTREFYEVARAILQQQNPMAMPEFIRKMCNKTGLKEPSVRSRLKESRILENRKTSHRHNEIYCKDINFDIEEAGVVRVLLRDRVQSEIKSILYNSPNIPITKGELYKEVKKTINVQRPTFYQYLDGINDFEQYKKGGHYYVLYRHSEQSEKIQVNMGKYNLDSAVTARLLRPISMLDIENVDIALFELGLIFENELKNYLSIARKGSNITVQQKDLRRLVDMINCVVREGVVTKGHHLGTLREERNKRAHGEHPTLEERTVLFNKAHYITDLFLTYISLFNQKSREEEGI